MERFVFAHVEARPGSTDVLWKAAAALAAPCRAEPGNLGYQVFRGVGNPGEIWFHAHWRDDESLDNHGKTDHVAAWLEVVREHAIAPVDVHVTTEQA